MRPGAAGYLLSAALFCGMSCDQMDSPSDHLSGAVPFQEVWHRSFCRSRETLVDILSEYPHEAEHIFKPPCVPLWRCAGCCGDESLECTPVETRTIKLQVIRVSAIHGTTRQEVMPFTEHTQCLCTPRQKRLKKERNHRMGGKRKPREPNPMPSTHVSCQLSSPGRHDAPDEGEEETMDLTETKTVPLSKRPLEP